jgi:hypothetical protein
MKRRARFEAMVTMYGPGSISLVLREAESMAEVKRWLLSLVEFRRGVQELRIPGKAWVHSEDSFQSWERSKAFSVYPVELGFRAWVLALRGSKQKYHAIRGLQTWEAIEHYWNMEGIGSGKYFSPALRGKADYIRRAVERAYNQTTEA